MCLRGTAARGRAYWASEIPERQADAGVLFPSFSSESLNVTDIAVKRSSQGIEENYLLSFLLHFSTM